MSYAEVIDRHFAKVPDRLLGPDGEPASQETVGHLVTASTEVSIVRLIGREMNQLDRTGVTQNPEYSDYTGDKPKRKLALKVIGRR